MSSRRGSWADAGAPERPSGVWEWLAWHRKPQAASWRGYGAFLLARARCLLREHGEPVVRAQQRSGRMVTSWVCGRCGEPERARVYEGQFPRRR